VKETFHEGVLLVAALTSKYEISSQTASCLWCSRPLEAKGHGYFDTRFGHPGSYDVVKCPRCGFEQTLPRPDAIMLQQLYKTYYNFGGEKGTSYACIREAFLNSLPYRLWLAIDGDVSFHRRKGRGHLLDYGCNEGRGLTIYRNNGYEVEGLELNARAADIARSKGFQVVSTSLADFTPTAPFDVVVLSNVLEHALDPQEMLRQVRGLLRKSGQVWISCPNSRSWQRSLFGRFWINWHVPFHIVHFSPQSLRAMLEDAGFRILEEYQESPSLWLVQSLISRAFAKKGHPTRQLRSILWVAPTMVAARLFLYPIFWLGNRLKRGDCLVYVAENTNSAKT
jgi:SAM-dependent methyltransferase